MKDLLLLPSSKRHLEDHYPERLRQRSGVGPNVLNQYARHSGQAQCGSGMAVWIGKVEISPTMFCTANEVSLAVMLLPSKGLFLKTEATLLAADE